jgi:hypothetical protein
VALLDNALMYGRFALGLRDFLRRHMSVAQAEEIIRLRVSQREETFLRIFKRGFVGNPRSPYHPLLKLAGCQFGDVERMVRSDGLEPALHALWDAGVYVNFEEFKGRTPIVRHGREFPVHSRDFDNPYLSRHYQAQTSGSTGAGTRIYVDLAHLVAQLPFKVMQCEVHGVLHVPTAVWRPISPSMSGLSNCLRGPVIGNTPERWFSQVANRDVRLPLKHRLATRYVLTTARLLGHALPAPELVPLDEPDPILDWVKAARRRAGACAVSAFVSSALRLCVAARDRGMDMTGVTFRGGGEPPTPGKVKAITGTGARWVPSYGTTESGQIGLPCGNPVDGNDLHVLKDSVALIQRQRQVPHWGTSVGAFYVTSLLPTAPKLMLNVGIDDYGVLEARSCGCPLESFGYTEHVREIRSYSKMTGEGLTLIETDLESILEEALPARFGGTPLDYQLLEEEDADGFTRLSLLVSPRVKLADVDGPVQALLAAMERGKHPEALAAAFWKQAGSLRLKRQEPVWSAGGKFMPLCVAERLKAAAAARR